MVVVEAASVSAAVNVATGNFVIGQTVNKETDSAMLRRIEEQAKNNSVLGAPTHEKLIADSPMVECLHETAKKELTPITRVQLESPMFSLSGSRRENPALLVILLSITPHFGVNRWRYVFSKSSGRLGCYLHIKLGSVPCVCNDEISQGRAQPVSLSG
jgi:hypothetical protein